MIFTTEKPSRDDALTVTRQAVEVAGEWPAGEGLNNLTRQLAARLHANIHNTEFESIVEAYDDYMGRLDWNHEEIMRYVGETRWHPALEDAAWDKALRILTETTNTILLALNYDLLDDAECAALYTTTTNTLRSAA